MSSIWIVDDFGRGLIKGLQGHPSLKRLDITNAKIQRVLLAYWGAY